MSINLNLDVPALERLLGGDSELEVKLRQGVIEEFARRHINKVVKDESFSRLVAEEARVARVALDALVRERIGYTKREAWTGEVICLADGVKQRITAEVDRQANKFISDETERIWKVLEPRIASTVNRRLEEMTAAYVKTLVNERLAAIAKAVSG